jgi:hypothetical protein
MQRASRKTYSNTTPADALVLFGVTGDFAHKMIVPALDALAVGVAQIRHSFAAQPDQLRISILRTLPSMPCSARRPGIPLRLECGNEQTCRYAAGTLTHTHTTPGVFVHV